MSKFLTFFIALSLAMPLSVTVAQSSCTSETAGKSRAQLEQELEACNREIAQWQETLNKTREVSASYSSDVALLTAKINAAQANIKAKNNQIASLGKDIAAKQSKINVLDSRIDRGRRAIADILRKTNDINSYSLVEAVLSDKDLSEFFVDMDTYTSTEEALSELFAELRTVKKLTESEKAALAKKREAEAAAKAAMEAAKKEVEVVNAEKKTLLAINDANKKTYEQVVTDRQVKAAKIRAELFQLLDIRPIEFGDALKYAEIASAKTGVRPAFILAILQYESKLGANVGRCNRPQDVKKWQDIMPGPLHYSNYLKNGKTCNGPNSPCSYRDDQSAFVRIMNSLSRSTEGTPLSCPIVGIPGWGGAMGPAQFIPTTWEMFQSKISQALNIGTPDPWNPEHAITAMALYLSELFAGTQDWTNERTAACKYNSGRTCYVNGKAGPGLSYGVNVMSIAESIQRDKIDPLQNL